VTKADVRQLVFIWSATELRDAGEGGILSLLDFGWARQGTAGHKTETTRVTAGFTAKFHGNRASALSLAVLWLGCAGCQTFNLSEEDFERQRSGQAVDREMGAAVQAVGTVGYYGAMLGALVAAAVRK
jgi:hypothetical protein